MLLFQKTPGTAQFPFQSQSLLSCLKKASYDFASQSSGLKQISITVSTFTFWPKSGVDFISKRWSIYNSKLMSSALGKGLLWFITRYTGLHSRKSELWAQFSNAYAIWPWKVIFMYLSNFIITKKKSPLFALNLK